MWLLIFGARAKAPVFFVSGAACSTLYATFNGYAKHYYCVKVAKRMRFWPNEKFQDPKLANCLISYMTQKIDPKTLEQYDDGYSVETDPIGTTSSCSGSQVILDYLNTKGYIENEDFFAVPYDWRISIFSKEMQNNLYSKLTLAIEDAFSRNHQMKCVLMGFSMGALIINTFLNDFSTKEWRDKYIDSLCFIGPALSGVTAVVELFLNLPFAYVQTAAPDITRLYANKLPGLFNLFPNYVGWGDTVIVIGPNGEKYTAKQLKDILPFIGIFRDEAPLMFSANEALLKKGPIDPHIRTCVVYNSKMDTRSVYNFLHGWDKIPSSAFLGGDQVVASVGIEWVCNHWSNIECHDMKCQGKGCDHAGLVDNSTTHELFYHFINH